MLSCLALFVGGEGWKKGDLRGAWRIFERDLGLLRDTDGLMG